MLSISREDGDGQKKSGPKHHWLVDVPHLKVALQDRRNPSRQTFTTVTRK